MNGLAEIVQFLRVNRLDFSHEGGIGATGGGSQGDYVLNSVVNVINAGLPNKTVTLPPAAPGRICFVINDRGIFALTVWPSSGHDCGAGTDTSMIQVTQTMVMFVGMSHSEWFAAEFARDVT